MISYARSRADLRPGIAHNHSIVEVVRVGIDIGVIGNRRAFTNNDFTAIIEQDVFVNYAVVLNGKVVAERDLNPVKDLHVLATMFEDVAGDHVAHAETEPVVQA